MTNVTAEQATQQEIDNLLVPGVTESTLYGGFAHHAARADQLLGKPEITDTDLAGFKEIAGISLGSFQRLRHVAEQNSVGIAG